MKRKGRGKECHTNDNNGFAEWGGYMEAKKTKLEDQFKIGAASEVPSENPQLFNGVAIFVNGYSSPSADELKLLMMKYGGIYHHYYRTNKTTHIIATNLPDTKVKQLKNMNVVKPDWIVESIVAGKLLDYRDYLLYSRQSKTQPKLDFKQIPSSSNTDNTVQNNASNTEKQTIPNMSSSDGQNNKSSRSLVSVKEQIYKSEDCQEVFKNSTTPSTSKSVTHSIKTASEAGFLSEFYNNSRLHHISTMGAMLKKYINDLREKGKAEFPGMEKLRHWKETFKEITTDPSGNDIVSYENIVMHIDMDCFFVSVGLRKRPDLKGFPVAVTHAKGGVEGNHRSGVNRKAEFNLYKTRREEKFKAKHNLEDFAKDIKPWSDWVEAIDESNSMSEIASCNYEARQKGVKNGMFLGEALKLCPNLKTIPYDFEGYKEVSNCLYNTVASYTLDIEAVSCDEMFVDCTYLLNSTGTSVLQLASILRAEIKENTGCPCSTGFGYNRLQARLATRRAKPDGQFFLEPPALQAFMQDISVSDLPGVGRSTSYKLATMGIKTCLDLQQISLARLKSEFGVKNGCSLYKSCRGEDTKKLVFGQIRKSVSAEVNYGIRFQNSLEAETFLQELAREVHNRLQEVNMKAKLVTLKLMVKAKDAPLESAKFLGHGVCDTVSRSSSVCMAIADVDSIIREVISLSRQLNVEPTELRGIGIQLSRLESCSNKLSEKGIEKFLRPKTEINRIDGEINNKNSDSKNESKLKIEHKRSLSSAIDDFFVEKKHKPNQNKETSSSSNTINPIEIDKTVLQALPDDIRKEVMKEYGINKYKDENDISKEAPPYSSHLNYSQIDLDILGQLPSEIQKEIQQSINSDNSSCPQTTVKSVSDISTHNETCNETPKLDERLSEKEVRALITAWTASEDSPQPCDMSMLAEYLEGLVYSRHLENLDTSINCLHRCIERRQNAEWQQVYHDIVNKVQSAMSAVYGLPLKVPKTFQTLS